MSLRAGAVAFCLLLAPSNLAAAEDLYRNQGFADIASDRRASAVGDILTVVVYQSAEARNAAANTSRTRRDFEGGLQSGSIDESASLSLDGGYSGQGEVRRSETFITQISVQIQEILPNGDFLVAGDQEMHVNGERTNVRIRGRVRPSDITGDNQILSSRIAEAEISYDGHGFVSRNARPNWIHRLFGLLGLGG
jgi:flagellar L-ring protein precursor FlgH